MCQKANTFAYRYTGKVVGDSIKGFESLTNIFHSRESKTELTTAAINKARESIDMVARDRKRRLDAATGGPWPGYRYVSVISPSLFVFSLDIILSQREQPFSQRGAGLGLFCPYKRRHQKNIWKGPCTLSLPLFLLNMWCSGPRSSQHKAAFLHRRWGIDGGLINLSCGESRAGEYSSNRLARADLQG